MRRFLHALCISTLSAAMVTANSAGAFTAKDLANEEAKFAAYSVKNGMRAAFLEFFAAQSWLLRPDMVDAQAWIRGRPDPPIVLDWKSQSTILSASGDKTVRIWNTTDGKMVKELGKARGGQFKDWLHAVSFSADGRWLVAADMAGAVQVWSLVS